MKILQTLIVATFFYSSGLVGQDARFTAAENSFSHGYYSSAVPVYQEILKDDSSDVYLNFKTGLCYLSSRSQRFKAVYHFQKAVSSTGTFNSAYATDASACINNICGFAALSGKEKITQEFVQQASYRFLGDAYYFINEFDRAIACYERYKTTLLRKKNDKALLDELNESIELCYFGKGLQQLKMPALYLVKENVIHENYKKKNTIKTSLTFSNKLNNDVAKAMMGRSFELPSKAILPVYTIQQVSKKKCMGKAADAEAKGNETTVGTSTDGQLVLVYRVNPEGVGNLYTTRLMNNVWTTPEKLDKIVNTNGWETGESISVDGTVMFFTSNKPGGYGGKDIYSSKKMPDGTWGAEINLGAAINTKYDEDAPFIYPNGTTLYFRSNGHQGSGCYDIFLSSFSDTVWSVPVNVGYPVDVSSDELAETSYTGTSQSSAEQENTNYLATFFNLEKVPLTLIKRQVITIEGKPIEDVKITITTNDGNVSAVYNSSRGSGNYLFVLPANKGTYVHYEAKGYFFQSEYIDFSRIKNMYESFKAVELIPVSKGSVITLNTVYFDKQDTTLKSASVLELDHFADFLSTNSSLKAQIAAYIRTDAGSRDDKKNALERAQVVTDYLISKGIERNRVSAKGYGKLKKKQAAKRVSDEQQQYEIIIKKA